MAEQHTVDWFGEGLVNLAEIIGDSDHRGSKVVMFKVDPGEGLYIIEACDEWYYAKMDAVQIGRLIDWLSDAKKQVGQP